MTAIRVDPIAKPRGGSKPLLDWDGFVVEVLRGTLTLVYLDQTVVLREGERFAAGGSGEPVGELT